MTGNADLPISGLVRSWPDVTREECAGYHVIDLPNGETIKGQWDLRGRMPEYIGNVDVRGKRVLDIGAASGFLTFEMERLGAREVVSFDADDHRRIANIPVWNSEYVQNRAKWKHDVDVFLTMLKNGYWYNHKRLKSKAACLYGDVYDIKAPDSAFDVVVVGQILVHLRDPITAIAEAARVAKETLVIAEGTYDSPETVGMLHARASKGGPPYIWWQLSLPAYQELLGMFGFEIERVHKAKYTCIQHEHASGDIEVTTIVARRRG
jgi:SAM-dependent methyltransferase